ncbi:cation:proton antiporter domain-containing protein [Mangrovihabitans endophyticus]|uniref:Cation/H+ exchanger transmembrane domain-containing protein n=1 Tax=Mangrovihabitans endophyticus TaxID=1751298 RepID=A0A8J3BWW2_9ACTN|nr:cation:proton antiporter [Mangrovihabitans endophyticus]GGK85074.1 hypothetical protein GCM10012284_19210 [Mangrovihabitans endophyticus]
MTANVDLAVKVMLALVVIVVATTVCGRLARRVGQPRVVGEMVAGVLLGPSLLGAFAPGVQTYLFAPSVKSVLYVLSTIGLTFYMFLVGVALDHGFFTRGAMRRAGLLATSGIVPTLLLGGAVAALVYDRLAVPGTGRWLFLLFVGGALSITAFPMLARILQERGIENTSLGLLTLVAASIDDAAAWILLALIGAFATGAGSGHALLTMAGTVVFAVLMLTVGRRLLRVLGDRADREGAVGRDGIALVIGLVTAAGCFTDAIGIYSVFGGFIAGLAIPQSPVLRRVLTEKLMDFNAILLLPVFFAYSGLNTKLGGIGHWALVPPLVLILLAGTGGKYLGCALTARVQGLSWRYASAAGGLMNARGLMILIFINVGLGYGIVSEELFSMLVIVAIVTTAAAMPIYRMSISPAIEEAERAIAAAGSVPDATVSTR